MSIALDVAAKPTSIVTKEKIVHLADVIMKQVSELAVAFSVTASLKVVLVVLHFATVTSVPEGQKVGV